MNEPTTKIAVSASPVPAALLESLAKQLGDAVYEAVFEESGSDGAAEAGRRAVGQALQQT